MEVAGQQLTATTFGTGSWDTFKEIELGHIKINSPGEVIIKLRAHAAATWKPINLRQLALRLAK